MSKKPILYFLVFSFLGGLCRYSANYFLSFFIPSILATNLLNWFGTFLLIVFVKGYMNVRQKDKEIAFALGTGFCGSFTTLSSTLLDLYRLILQGEIAQFLFYLLLVVFGGLGVAILSLNLSERYFK
ncbi:MAG: CrcB family protein [Streptococcus sp.]|nr:CrcB family protein [Streptococcus sp.]